MKALLPLSALAACFVFPSTAYSACKIEHNADVPTLIGDRLVREQGELDACEEQVRVKADMAVVDLLSQTGLSSSALQLDYDSDASAITLGVARDISKSSHKKFSETQISLKFSLPLDSQDSSVSSIINTGLAGDAEIKFSLSSVLGKPSFSPRSRGKSVGDLSAEIVLAEAKCREVNKVDESFKPCEMQTDNSLALDFLDDDTKKKISDAVERNNSPLWFFNAEAGIGIKEEDYFDRSTLSSIEQDITPYSISGTIGVLPSRRGLFLGVGGVHKRTFEDASSETVCLQGAAMDESNCVTGTFSPLEKNVDTSAYALARYQDPNGIFGVEIRAGYDFEDDIFGIEAPIHLFRNENGNLTGGVKVSWDDDSDFKFGVFVGAPFNFFSGNN